MKKSLTVIFILASLNVFSQQMKMISSENAVMLSEFPAVIIAENEKMIVDFAAPADQRDEEYQSVDIEKGDQVKFINGTRVKSAEDFREVYNALNEGDEVELGIQRGDESFFVTFDRSGEKDIKNGQTMTITLDKETDSEELKKEMEKEGVKMVVDSSGGKKVFKVKKIEKKDEK